MSRNANPLIMNQDDRPDARAHEPGVRRQDPGCAPAGDDPGGHDGEDAAHAERLGRQVGRERGEERDDDLERRVGRSAARPRSGTTPTTTPTAIPPTADDDELDARPRRSRTSPRSPPRARRGTAISAVASLIRLSPSRIVTIRGATPSRRKIAVAATASGGATIAPRANAAARELGRSGRSATAPTTTVVNSTRPTASRPIGRRFALKSRIGVK